jgi:hypothetical protein
MTPEFYLILKERDADDELTNAVCEAGFDDSELTVRGEHVAIWVCDREGELTQLVREALQQAKAGGLQVLHVEMESEVFAKLEASEAAPSNCAEAEKGRRLESAAFFVK